MPREFDLIGLGNSLVDILHDALEARMRRYFNAAFDDDIIESEIPVLMAASKRFDPKATRRQLLSQGFAKGQILRYAYRPFDVRWVFWYPETKLLDEKRIDYVRHLSPQNWWLLTTGRTRKGIAEPAYCTPLATDYNFQDSGARVPC